jgi:hypothetical protein
VRPAAAALAGILLFLFIPLVLWLFVAQPEPIALSLGAGVALMLGHRFVAAPYAARVRGAKCVWCNRAVTGPAAALAVRAGAAEVDFAACPRHVEPTRRFFAWLDRLRLPLRAGIALPLLGLLGTLGAAAAGAVGPGAGALATDLFRFVVGLTVNLAALGPLAGRTGAGAPRAAFPLHNFSLLGVRNLLWIFRLVGLWWMVDAGRALTRWI